jgi:pimeloyl-ACP methyl ester carboxylesterase
MPNEEVSSTAGGAATALGMAFQHRVAAWLAVRILAEANAGPLWDWPNSSTIEFIRCETEQPVDDIMVGSSDDRVAFIQVKRSISLERNSDSPFAKTVAQFVRQALRPSVHNNRPARPWDRMLDFGRDRLVLAVGPDASVTVTSTLGSVSTKIRSLHQGASIDEAAQSLVDKETLGITCDHIRAAWQAHSGTAPSDDDIRKLLSITYVQVFAVESDGREEREATDTIRSAILLRPDEAQAAWTTLIDRCSNLASRRGGHNRRQLQNFLEAAGFSIRADASFQPSLIGASATPRTVSQDHGESKRRLITSIEFTLECPFSEFDGEKFKVALKLATGIDESLVRIASIRSGSTIVKIDGEQETLAAIIRTVQFSQQVLKQLALETGMRKMAWEIDGTRYELAVDSHKNDWTKTKEVILLIHGIRDFAEWEDLVSPILTEGLLNTEIIPLKYGRFDAFRFWFPFWTRAAPINNLLPKMRDVRTLNPTAKLSVIAHSFGTYAIGEILRENPDIRLHRLILCGAILSSDLRWDKIPYSVETKIINDCGRRDIWPVLAQSTTFGYGTSGRFGFGDARTLTRFHNFGHAGFFDKEFVSEFWLPWFRSGQFVKSKAPQKAGTLWHLLTIIQIKWLAVLLCAVGILWFGTRGLAWIRFDPGRSNFSVQKAQEHTEGEIIGLQSKCLDALKRLTNPLPDATLAVMNRLDPPVTKSGVSENIYSRHKQGLRQLILDVMDYQDLVQIKESLEK